MSDEKNNGGPAFPFEYDANNQSSIVPHTGMTLRDYFAAKAMAALIMAIPHGDNAIGYAQEAYEMADDMLKTREQ